VDVFLATFRSLSPATQRHSGTTLVLSFLSSWPAQLYLAPTLSPHAVRPQRRMMEIFSGIKHMDSIRANSKQNEVASGTEQRLDLCLLTTIALMARSSIIMPRTVTSGSTVSDLIALKTSNHAQTLRFVAARPLLLSETSLLYFVCTRRGCRAEAHLLPLAREGGG